MTIEYNPSNKNPRTDGKRSWSEAYVPTKDRPRNERVGFHVEDRR